MTTQSLRLQLAEQLQALSGEQVKALVVQWLLTSDATIAGLDQHLMATEPGIEFGEVDAGGTFHSVSEAAMIEQSLAALEYYQQTGVAISHDRIQQWANSLDGDRTS